ncbi:hypothetical protein BTVI_107578 [Pitangus sulphuratus]|nr:hypothetical protein BTVI_107578 [Pitangus sulphuratus]
MSRDEKHMLISSEDTTMGGEVDILKGGAAISRDLDGLEDEANIKFIKFNIYEEEKSQAIKGSDYLLLLKAF